MVARTATARIAPRAIAAYSRAGGPSCISSCENKRSFFSLPSSDTQTLHAHRTLPYAPAPLYDIIANIDAYSAFIPYCSHSLVTYLSPPDPQTGRRWPTQADLTAGWSGLSETYTSRVFCVPDSGIVEAISGDARTKISEAELSRWGLRDPGPQEHDDGPQGSVFKSLVTRWTVRPLEAKGNGQQNVSAGKQGVGDWSVVDLSIKFRFTNPLYGAVSSAVADKVAPMMIEAFMKEARKVLGKPGT
ncbi:cyclase/dehydrase family protein [Xylariales sp. AK1849]|nr:cyclase/dehydrase family protein [Xylariales sp. AK1849]